MPTGLGESPHHLYGIIPPHTPTGHHPPDPQQLSSLGFFAAASAAGGGGTSGGYHTEMGSLLGGNGGSGGGGEQIDSNQLKQKKDLIYRWGFKLIFFGRIMGGKHEIWKI